MLTKGSVNQWIHDIMLLQDAYIIKISDEDTDHVNKEAALVKKQGNNIHLMFFSYFAWQF